MSAIDDQSLLDGRFQDKEYLQHAFRQPTFEGEQQRLARCIEQVDRSLRECVEANHEQLIATAACVGGSHNDIAAIKTSTTTAANAVARLRHTIAEPYVLMREKVNEYRAGTEALDYLRRVQRFLSLVAKLKDGSVTSDLTRNARVVRDIEDLLAERDLSGIEAVDAEMPLVTGASTKVRSAANDTWRSALSHNNQGDLTVALQALHTLGTVTKVIAATIAEQKREALKTIVKDLDVNELVRLANPTEAATSATSLAMSGRGGSGADADKAARDAVFQRMEAVFGRVLVNVNALLILWSVLSKKKDVATQQPFIETLAGGSGAVTKPAGLTTTATEAAVTIQQQLEDFWSTVAQNIKERLQKAAKRGVLPTLLVAEFARYVRTLRIFAEGVNEFLVEVMPSGRGDSAPLSSSTTVGSGQLQLMPWLRECVAEIEERFSRKLGERYQERLDQLRSKIQAACPSQGAENVVVDDSGPAGSRGGGPSARGTPAVAMQLANSIDVRAVTKSFAADITSNRHESLCLDAAVKWVVYACEGTAKRIQEGLSRATIVPMPSLAQLTMGQVFGISLANAAFALDADVHSALTLLPAGVDDATGKLRDVSGKLVTQFLQIVSPYYHSTLAALLHHIDTACAEYEALIVTPSQRTTSAAIEALKDRAQSIHAKFFALIDRRADAVLEPLQARLADALVARLVSKVAVLRPMTDAVCARVGHDLQSLTNVLLLLSGGPSTTAMRRQGQLRALRTLLGAAAPSGLAVRTRTPSEGTSGAPEPAASGTAPVEMEHAIDVALPRLPAEVVFLLTFHRFVSLSDGVSFGSVLQLQPSTCAAKLECALRDPHLSGPLDGGDKPQSIAGFSPAVVAEALAKMLASFQPADPTAHRIRRALHAVAARVGEKA